MPDFLSILTPTEFSWLQKRQVKLVGSGSLFFLVGTLRPDFLRLPYWLLPRVGFEDLMRSRIYHFSGLSAYAIEMRSRLE
jgi:hypothetical protein